MIPDYSNDFSAFDGKVWLNTASEGPLPVLSAKALAEAITWKQQPHQLTFAKFLSVPVELKKSIGRLIGVDAKDVILGNSATYGIDMLSRYLPWQQGDEILLMNNDFPTNILPWLSLSAQGVIARQIKAKDHVLTVKEIEANITAKTRLICLSMVHTFSGHALDVHAIGALCRARNIIFVLNVSQALGAFPVDIGKMPVDALTCAGYKWLLGPYGTGFCWMTPALRETLRYQPAYWQQLDEAQIVSTDDVRPIERHDARSFDVFAPANFFNYVPWRASIDYLLGIGLKRVCEHNRFLVDQVIDGLDHDRYRLISPSSPKARTNIIVFSHVQADRNAAIFEQLNTRGIYLALWKGNLRVSAHVHNTVDDIKHLMEALDACT